MSADAGPIPPGVAGEAKQLETALGVQPTFEPLEHNVWRVTFQSERVAVTFDLRGGNRGGFDQVDSTLTVDGNRRKLARDLEQLTAFFTDTTATLNALKVDIVVPEEADVKAAPAAVQHMYGQLAAKVKNGDATLQASQPNADTWVVGLYMIDIARVIEITFRRVSKKKWGIVTRPYLVIDGEDWSNEARGLEEAMLLFVGGANPRPADTHQAVRPQGPQSTATSVQVRKTTVIRT